MNWCEQSKEPYPSLYAAQNRSDIQAAFTRKRSVPFPHAQCLAGLKPTELGLGSRTNRGRGGNKKHKLTLILNLVLGTFWLQSGRTWQKESAACPLFPHLIMLPARLQLSNCCSSLCSLAASQQQQQQIDPAISSQPRTSERGGGELDRGSQDRKGGQVDDQRSSGWLAGGVSPNCSLPPARQRQVPAASFFFSILIFLFF